MKRVSVAMIIFMASVTLLVVLVLAMGQSSYGTGSGEVTLYYAVRTEGKLNRDVIGSENRTISGEEKDPETVLEELLSGPATGGLVSPFPEGLRLLGCTVENGEAMVDLSYEYVGLSGFDLTVANYCITLTLCDLEGVDSVGISVMGSSMPMMGRNALTPDDVLLENKEEHLLERQITLYFADPDTGLLVSENRTVTVDINESVGQYVMAQLIKGPETEELESAMPEGTKLLSVSVRDGVCYVNLSGEFMTNRPTSRTGELLTIYSIVDSLTLIEDIDKVQIYINGGTADIYRYLSINSPLERRDDLIAEK